MSIIPFTEYDMSKTDFDSVIEIYNNLKLSYLIEPDYNFQFNFKDFHAFYYNEINDFGPVIKITNSFGKFYLVFPEVIYNIPKGRYSPSSSVEFQTWGILPLKNMYGHVLVKKETLLDKIHELINPIELDFDDDNQFSRNYYVVTTDEPKAIQLLSPAFRSIIQEIKDKDFIIEIFNNNLIIGNKKVIDLTTAMEFASFLSDTSRHI
jgi:hypothetical protein